MMTSCTLEYVRRRLEESVQNRDFGLVRWVTRKCAISSDILCCNDGDAYDPALERVEHLNPSVGNIYIKLYRSG